MRSNPVMLKRCGGPRNNLLRLAAFLIACAAAGPVRASGVVGTCDQAHLQAALAGGGLVTFTCGGHIALTSLITISLNTVLDGTGETVTLDGQNSIVLFSVNSGATLSLNNLTIANGSGSHGGAIVNAGTLIVNNSTFSGNSASQTGGAIWNQAALLIDNSTFSGNSAGLGGGAILTGGTPIINNSTFSGNSAGTGGGAIWNNGALTLTYSTFSGNSATGGSGGAIFNDATVAVGSTIFANSPSGGDCYNSGGTITDGDYNLADDNSCGFTMAHSQNNATNLNLGSLANNGGPTQTIAVTPPSPAIAPLEYTTNGCATTIVADQRGVGRPGSLNGSCTIGAYEYVPTPSATITDCTDVSTIQNDIAGAGRIVFACSGDIKLTQPLTIAYDTTIDATGYKVILDGGGTNQVLNNENEEGVLTLNNLTIASGNAVQGGGILNYGTVVVTNSTLSGNTATTGGGIYGGLTAIISNSTFSGNTASAGGGGIANVDTLVITNSTFSGNSAASGGAMYDNSGMGLRSTIIANSPSGQDCYIGFGTVYDHGYNLDDDGSCGLSSTNNSFSNNPNANLGSLGSNGGATQTVPLQYPSSAIDVIPVGTNGCGLSADQRRIFRPQGVACDIGAYEANQIPVGFATNPAGLSYTAAGTNYNAAAAPFLVVGGQYAISTTSPQSGGTGTRYVWQNWSDSGAISHNITVPSTPASYTANFQTQYQLITGVNLSTAGTVSPASGGYYNAGAIVNLAASANPGYKFLSWTGNVANPNSASTTVTMTQPQTVIADFGVQVTVARNPSSPLVGPVVFVDGAGYNRTFPTFWWLPGSKHTLGTNSPQTVNGTTYTFVKWSDGGAENHSVAAPTTPATYTVTFSTK